MRVENTVPEGLLASDWSGIRAAYAAEKLAITAHPDGHHVARHSGQAWNTIFDGQGFRVCPDSGDWSWGLALHGYTFGDGPTVPLETPEVTSRKNWLVYRWDSTVQEWFINRAEGLQQGWTIAKRPRGAEAHSTLKLTLAVSGGLIPQVASDRRSVSFASTNGPAAVTYSGLHAWDADGVAVPVVFTAGEGADLIVEADIRQARFPVIIDPIAQQAYLKASNPDPFDEFGGAVAISGNTVVVGAFSEDSSAVGVNGNQANNAAQDAGAVYVFERIGGVWTQQAYLKASNAGTFDAFGAAVAISGDTIVVGARNEDSDATGVNGDQSSDSATNSGAAYVFVRSGGVWTQQAYLKASNTEAFDFFGASVAISGDTIVVGATLEDSNATGVNGDQSNNSIGNSGASYVFERVGGFWTQQAYLKAFNTGEIDGFGEAVAVSGDIIVVGASNEDSNATGVNGNQTSNGALNSGAAYVFARTGGIWAQQAYLKASNTDSNDRFGFSVAVSGGTVIIGAPEEGSSATRVNGNQTNNSALSSGAAYVFVSNGSLWSQQAYLKASNTTGGDFFGASVSISGDTVAIGARQATNTMDGAGAAYVFERTGGIWTQQANLKASNAGSSRLFGNAVSVSGKSVVVGAPLESSNAVGVNGNEADNSASGSGAAYIFDVVQAQPARPKVVVTGGKTIRSERARVVVRGTASGDAGIKRVEFKTGKGGFKKAQGGKRWRAVVRLKKNEKSVVRIRAIDLLNQRSKVVRVRVIRK